MLNFENLLTRLFNYSPYAMILLLLRLLFSNLQGNSILAYESNIEGQKQATFNVCA